MTWLITMQTQVNQSIRFSTKTSWDFLSDMFLRATIDDQLSNWLPVKLGLFQGSWGKMFFNPDKYKQAPGVTFSKNHSKADHGQYC